MKQHQTIDRKNIRFMMDLFYSQVLKDEIIADFFIEKLGDEMISDEWQIHLNLLTDFWMSTILGESAYKGQPIKPHIHMEGLKRASFEAWLQLFFQTVDKVYTKEPADIFKTKSKSIANNFMKLLKL
ncbi:group III truncated hemoglobin [Sulfurimonas sp. SAG-AH-194-L11]|nr:group III truncated hemoglobin [Sulfurimonas sp. SAG-AH-194-L11]MDF1876750.1 group III truncated hemoglobin [Sulfurimonas sp. SAG-AH-194-L11]